MNIQMIRRILVFSLAYLFGTYVVASNGKTEKGLLWKIEGEGIQTSYLYGTIHLMPNKDFQLADEVLEAFASSTLVVMELDMDDIDFQTALAPHMLLPGELTLEDYLSPRHYLQLDSILTKTMGVGMAAFGKMKPAVVAQLMMMPYLGDQPASYEATFTKMAAEQEKEIEGLETVEYQAGVLFDSISYEDQAQEIAMLLNGEFDIPAFIDEMISSYNSGDYQALHQQIEAYYPDNERAMDLLLNRRNIDWIPKMKDYASEESTFFAVGAGHLGGHSGLIQLLRDAGYLVSPITN